MTRTTTTIPLESVRLDGDDLTDVLTEIETSFGVSLPNNLMHISTVGDLFEEVLKARTPDGVGDRCDSAMVFYRLRRFLTPFGLAEGSRPTTALSGRGLPVPRRISRLLKDEFGFTSPGIVVSWLGCVFASSIVLAAIGLALASWSYGWLSLWLLVLPVLALDRGGWEGDWRTLGSLSRAIAIRNVALLANAGSRNGEADWWRSFSYLIAETVFDEQNRAIEHGQLGRTTRFAFT